MTTRIRGHAPSPPGRPRGAAIGGGAAFSPPWWGEERPLQTVWGPLFRTDRLPLRRERLSTPDGDFVDLDWLDADGRGRRADAPRAPRSRGLVALPLRVRAPPGRPGGGLDGRRVQLPVVQRRAEPAPALLSLRRDGRPRLGGRVARGAGPRRAHRRRRRVPRRERPPQVARRGGRDGARGAPGGGRDLGPLRRGRLRARPRPRIPPPRLRRQLPADDALEGRREGAALSGLRRRGGDAPGADLRPVRPRRHGAAQRLPGRGRLLDDAPRAAPTSRGSAGRPSSSAPTTTRSCPAAPCPARAISRRTSAPSSRRAADMRDSSRGDGPGARAPGRSGAPSSS